MKKSIAETKTSNCTKNRDELSHKFIAIFIYKNSVFLPYYDIVLKNIVASDPNGQIYESAKAESLYGAGRPFARYSYSLYRDEAFRTVSGRFTAALLSRRFRPDGSGHAFFHREEF